MAGIQSDRNRYARRVEPIRTLYYYSQITSKFELRPFYIIFL